MAEEVKKAAPKKASATKKETAPKKEEVKEAKVEAPKKEKVAKEEAKVSEKAKPTSVRAIAKNVRVTPRKVRLVIDLVRGKDVKVALGILANVNKSATEPVVKVIKSAAANAINNFGFDENGLYISEIYANEGIRMKRFIPRAKGSASGLVKRSAHITCVVKAR